MWLERYGRRRSHLARLSSTEQQHLNLVFGHHAVSLELALDLVISCDSAESVNFGVCDKKLRINKRTGFSLAIDGGGLYATHFDKLLQSCVWGVEQETKEWRPR